MVLEYDDGGNLWYEEGVMVVIDIKRKGGERYGA